MNFQIFLKQFDEKYSTNKLYKKTFKKVKNIIFEQKKIYFKKGIKTLSNIAITNNKKKKNI